VSSYLDELYAHQAWADAEHWRAFEAHPAALGDKAISERLLHIHQVQYAFLWITGSRTSDFAFKKLDDFSSMADLKQYAQRYHVAVRELCSGLDQNKLEEIVEASWFTPPVKLSRRHAMTQAAMHSHYHRGQNATRLRELGGVPPMTDFIIWLRKGQPTAQWT
jgi:uncharacterized damage-inducible protein DinB